MGAVGDARRRRGRLHRLARLGPARADGLVGHVVRPRRRGAPRPGVPLRRDRPRRRIAPSAPTRVAAANHLPPSTASIVADLDLRVGRRRRGWRRAPDDSTARRRSRSTRSTSARGAARSSPGKRWPRYDELADTLADHAAAHGFTHVELLPIMEHPFYGSWGYQTTGYFAPTSRYGSPTDMMRMVDRLHQRGVGVILDWVPSHFPMDGHAPGPLRRHPPLRARRSPPGLPPRLDVGDLQLRPAPRCARSSISSAISWLERYHVDGLRVDAVASMLYLDYSREAGEWIPNAFGGRENLEAIDFLKQLNVVDRRRVPRHGHVRRGVDGVAAGDRAGRRRRPRVHLQVGHGLDARHVAVPRPRPGAPPVPPRRDHVPQRLRVQRALRPAAVARRGGARQGVAPRQDARRRVAAIRQRAPAVRADVGPAGQEAAVHGRRAGRRRREWDHESTLDWALHDTGRHGGVRRLVADLNAAYAARGALHAATPTAASST